MPTSVGSCFNKEDKMQKLGYRFRLMVFTLILLIVSIICLFFNEEASDDYTEEVSTDNNEQTSKQEVETDTENIDASASTLENIIIEESNPLEKWSSENIDLLAKIAMAEAEGEDIEGKALVIRVILNRVDSTSFPDTVKEVIFQNNGKTYQFSPVIPGGRWYTTEPNEECYQAVAMVQDGWDNSNGALYFESCKNEDNWHSRNLTFLFKHGCHRFYKE